MSDVSGISAAISTDAWRDEIVAAYGPFVPLAKVWPLLSLPSADAARKAAARGAMPVRCVTLPDRRGWYLSAVELAEWLGASIRSIDGGGARDRDFVRSQLGRLACRKH